MWGSDQKVNVSSVLLILTATILCYVNSATIEAYHICHDGREGHQGASFLCSNGTLFNQHEFTCDWWYNVNCAEAPTLYSLNLDPLKNPYAPKPKPEEAVLVPHQQEQHLYGRK